MVIANTGGNTISVLRNTSSASGSLDFASKIDFTTGTSPRAIAISDLDNDGRADIVVSNNASNTISVFKNLSSAVGNINFGAKVDYDTGNEPCSVTIADIDGDGKVDLVVADEDLSVFRNTTTSIGLMDFAVRQQVSPLTNTCFVVAGDLTGDGKADLIETKGSLNTVGVFENISSGPGNISFDVRVEFGVGTIPNAIAIGDIDGDGELDLAVTNSTANSVSLLKNRSLLSGFLSFSPAVDFPTRPEPGSVSLSDMDGDGKLDLVVTSTASSEISVLRNTVSTSDTKILRLEGNMDFGNVAINSSANRTLTIHNDGNSTLTLNSLSFNGVPQFVNDPGTLVNNLQVTPLASTDVVIAFAPTEAQSYQTTLTVSSDKTSGENTIELLGTGVAGPIAYYPFNGNANDESGNGLNGTIVGATLTADRFDSPNTAFDFDGVDDYIDLGNDDFLKGKNAATISLFINADDLTNDQTILHLKEGFIRIDVTNQLMTDLFIDEVFNGLIANIVENSWNHVALRYDGSKLQLYVDLELESEVAISGLVGTGLSFPNSIGAEQSAELIDFFNGQIDDIRIYDRALSDQEISSLGRENSWNINSSPTEISLSNNQVLENLPSNSVIGTLTTVDLNLADTHTYSFIGGSGGELDNARFDIVNGNELVTNEVFDFETKSSYSIRVQTDDGFTGVFEKAFTIEVVDVNEEANLVPAITSLSNNLISENEPINTVIGSFSNDDPDIDDVHTYSFVTGEGDDDNASFAIQNVNELISKEVFDFELKSSYSIRVRTDDGKGGILDLDFSISVVNVDEGSSNQAPTDISISNNSIAESLAVFTDIGVFSTTDPDGGSDHSYALITGETAAFQIVAGNLLQSTQVFDFDSQSSYSITVRTTDAGGLTFDKEFVITIVDAEQESNQAPTDINLTNNSIFDNLPTFTQIGILSTTDPDEGDIHTYSLLSEITAFQLMDNSLESKIVFDATMKDSYSVIIRTTDAGGLSFDKEFIITITDGINNPPTAISLSNTTVGTGAQVGTIVGTFSTKDLDVNDTFSYIKVAGNGIESKDNFRFDILGSNLVTNTELVPGDYSIRIETSDGEAFFSRNFLIEVIEIVPSNIVGVGNGVENYRIFGIPSNSAQVHQVFPGLDVNDQGSSWRITSYDGGMSTDLSNSSTLSGGDGYWFLSTKEPTVNLESLPPVELNEWFEFEINLTPGWNLISNPFLEELNFEGVIAWFENREPVANLSIAPYTYNGTYNVSSSLQALEGGWVFSEFEVTLRLINPTNSESGRKTTGTRLSPENSWYSDSQNWQLILQLSAGKLSSNLAGIGMRSGATNDVDHFDLRSPPEISPGRTFGLADDMGLSRNFKEPSNQKSWDFQIQASDHDEVTLSWDQTILDKLGENLYLYVPEMNRTFNMQSVSQLTLTTGSSIRIILGDDYDKGTLDFQTKVYPNPMDNHAFFQFFVDGVEDSYEVSVLIYTIDGQIIHRSSEWESSGQTGTIEIDDMDLPSGLYLYQIRYNGRSSQLKKLIMK